MPKYRRPVAGPLDKRPLCKICDGCGTIISESDWPAAAWECFECKYPWSRWRPMKLGEWKDYLKGMGLGIEALRA